MALGPSQKDEDIGLLMVADAHLDVKNEDLQMDRGVYRRRLDGYSRNSCNLLAVLCGKVRSQGSRYWSPYAFPELVSSGRLEVQVLVNPTIDEFQEVQKSFSPNFLYFQGEQQLENREEIGNLIWGFNDVSDPEMFSSLVGSSPTIIYLEVPNSERIANALYAKGVPYVIYWKNAFSSYAASHFRQALLSVIQSSYSHTCDAYQLAHASFRLYCVRNNHVMPSGGQSFNGKLGPHLLGDAPKINVPIPERISAEEESSSDGLPSIKVHEEEIDMGFLVCGVPCTLDACLLGSLEDGLSALLNVEIRGSRLINRISAAPPPLQAAAVSRGVLTMRCDLMTCSSAHVSLLVSGSAQTCFDDELLESYIKNELIEKGHLVHALPNNEETKSYFSQPPNSISIACGASVFEVRMKVPNWAVQVLKQLAPLVSYRSLVALGIAGIQGTPVASFEKEDADRLLFFCTKLGKESLQKDHLCSILPTCFVSPIKKRFGPEVIAENRVPTNGGLCWREAVSNNSKRIKLEGGICISTSRKKLKTAVIKPIPHTRSRKMMPFAAVPITDTYDTSQVKLNLPTNMILPTKHSLVPPALSTQRKPASSSLRAPQIIPLNPLPLKNHGCDRPPIRVCSEDEFLKDIIEFLIFRGHSRLVPQGGISEFPDAILNGKRLDLYNLYREVVSRGGFYVGNGINWKGQVFSKMHNHTASNRMTGVGNTLKRHYETYLLEYELAHDDVDGECCLLCHSSTPGDWVNCGLCGEWAHFGCDRRQGLGSFKDYAKTDGLEYICPNCSLKRRTQKTINGFSRALNVL